MNITSIEELSEHINDIIEYLSDRDDMFYVALEIAHQLRDELDQTLSDNV
jgi:hypothetical protein